MRGCAPLAPLHELLTCTNVHDLSRLHGTRVVFCFAAGCSCAYAWGAQVQGEEPRAACPDAHATATHEVRPRRCGTPIWAPQPPALLMTVARQADHACCNKISVRAALRNFTCTLVRHSIIATATRYEQDLELRTKKDRPVVRGIRLRRRRRSRSGWSSLGGLGSPCGLSGGAGVDHSLD